MNARTATATAAARTMDRIARMTADATAAVKAGKLDTADRLICAADALALGSPSHVADLLIGRADRTLCAAVIRAHVAREAFTAGMI